MHWSWISSWRWMSSMQNCMMSDMMTHVKKDGSFFSASSTISFKMLMALHSNIFMLNSWFDISPNKWHQKWRHKKLRSIVKKAQMTTSLYQSVYFWQLGCRDFISYCFGLAKFKLNSLNLIFSRVFLHWVWATSIKLYKTHMQPT